jgi:hypothetical protein
MSTFLHKIGYHPCSVCQIYRRQLNVGPCHRNKGLMLDKVT